MNTTEPKPVSFSLESALRIQAKLSNEEVIISGHSDYTLWYDNKLMGTRRLKAQCLLVQLLYKIEIPATHNRGDEITAGQHKETLLLLRPLTRQERIIAHLQHIIMIRDGNHSNYRTT